MSDPEVKEQEKAEKKPEKVEMPIQHPQKMEKAEKAEKGEKSSISKRAALLPKHVHLLSESDFEKFSETAMRAGAICLYPQWLYSSKVGGGIF